jgi:diadenosine tetraphosphate (Ap4A) HIT family hydrolase
VIRPPAVAGRGTADPTAECPFCKVIRGESKALCDTVLFQNKDFIVVPAKGHFWIGYLLIITKEHLYSFAAVRGDRQLRNLNEAVGFVRTTLDRVFGAATIFEHASMFGAKSAGSTIDHAHLHAVPCDKDLCRAVLDDRHCVRRLDGLNELRHLVVPYLFIDDHKGYCYVSEVDDQLPRQYLRQRLYNLLYPNREDNGWDWEAYEHPDLLKKTLEVVSNGGR